VIPPEVQAQIDEGFAEAELWMWRGRLIAQLEMRRWEIMLRTALEDPCQNGTCSHACGCVSST
jgi:hypothetical protein